VGIQRSSVAQHAAFNPQFDVGIVRRNQGAEVAVAKKAKNVSLTWPCLASCWATAWGDADSRDIGTRHAEDAVQHERQPLPWTRLWPRECPGQVPERIRRRGGGPARWSRQ
jgi:hypothetical protein